MLNINKLQKYKHMKILIIIFCLFSVSLCRSQVIINEYSCSNVSTITDNYGNYEDWIELYNTSGTAVNLTGYYLSDKATNPAKWQFPAGISIAANGHLMIYCSGNDIIAGTYIHTNFKLTQTKPESIVFSNPTGTIIENIVLQPAQKNHSRGRETDGSATWAVFLTPTPGLTNTGAVQEYVATPVFSQNAGFYASSVSLTITCATPGSTIRYTLDGSEPTAASIVYSGAINIASTKVFRAKAFSANPAVPPSFVQSNTYFINVTHTVAVISIFGDEIEDLMNGNIIEPETGIEYFDKNLQYKAESTGEANKHGQDSWSFNQRGIDYITRDQFGYNYGLLEQMFTYSDRDKFQRIILKAAAGDGYPCAIGWNPPEYGPAHIRDAYVHTLSQRYNLHLNERTYEPCVMYVNGQYWGVYEIREKVDDADFTDYYYNQDESNLQFIKCWGSTWAEYDANGQTLTDWNNLVNFIETNNMAIQSNYDYVESLLNVKSLADYFLLNSYVVCKDWLNWNTGWWRGLNLNGNHKKWGYILWDEDATFGAYINYTGIPDISPNADPCFPEESLVPDPGGNGHTDILVKLLENPGFHQYYISRYADLLNTAFKCDNMQFLLDSLIALIQPEMPGQIAHWGGTMAEWQQNVQNLKNFIDDRCAVINNGLIDCYTLTGPFSINFQVDPPNTGKIKVNSIWVPTYPWSATYFGNIQSILIAKATAPNYAFDYWELVDTVVPDTITDSVTTTFTVSQTVIAHFKTIIPPVVIIGVVTNPQCYGDNLGSVDISVSGGITSSGTYQYQWSNGNSSQDIYYLGPGTYTVTVTDDSTGVAVASFIITQPSPINLTLPSDTQICNGETVVINASVSGGTLPYTYIWSNGDITSGIIVTPDVETTYSVTVTDSNGCPGGSGSIHVIVSQSIILNVSASMEAICPGEIVQLTVNISQGGGPPYMVYNSDGNVLVPPINITPESSGLQYLYVQDGCGSVAHDSVYITVNPNPTVTFVSDTVSGCEPLTVTFNPGSAQAGQTYFWNFGDASNNAVSYDMNPVHEFTQDGTFDVSLTITSAQGCSNTYTHPQMIIVFPVPVARFVAKPPFASIVKPQVIFTNLSELANTYLWSFGDGDSSSIVNPMHWYSSLGSYLVQLIAITNKGCSDTVNSTIVIRDEYTFYAPTAISPDFDHCNDVFYVLGNGISTKNFELYIFDRWGEIIYETSQYDPEHPEKYGWNGSAKGDAIVPVGSYTWMVKYYDGDNIQHNRSGVVNVIR